LLLPGEGLFVISVPNNKTRKQIDRAPEIVTRLGGRAVRLQFHTRRHAPAALLVNRGHIGLIHKQAYNILSEVFRMSGSCNGRQDHA
jgi:hypothetical protein